MDEVKLAEVTRWCISGYYEMGNIRDIMEEASDEIVGYGTKSLHYAVGKKAVENLLRHELAVVTPCRLVKMKLQDYSVGNEVTITANVILNLAESKTPIIMHRLSFMYERRPGRGYKLTGIHIFKDLRYASTYRIMSDRLLNAKEIPEEVRYSKRLTQLVSSRMETVFCRSA